MSLDEFREARAAEKRNAAVAAARRIFAQRGFAAASTAGIAAEAGMSTATLYRYFPSKQALFAAAVASAVDELGSGLDKVPDGPRERLHALAQRYALLLSRPETRGIVRALVAEADGNPQIAACFDVAGKGDVGARFAEAVSALAASGAVQLTIDTAHAAGQLQGMIEHNTLLVGLVRGNQATSAIPPETVAEQAVATWFARFGAGRAT